MLFGLPKVMAAFSSSFIAWVARSIRVGGNALEDKCSPPKFWDVLQQAMADMW